MQQVQKAVIPVAGLGTRFLPITKAIPKEMLPIVDKPTIQFIVEEALSSGIEQLILVNGRHKSSIEEYFDVNVELEDALKNKQMDLELGELRKITQMSVCSVRQKQALGLGHAVLCARSLIGNEPFAVLLGDDVYKTEDSRPAIGQLIDRYDETGVGQVALIQVSRSEIHLYGAAEGTQDPAESRSIRISGLVEKPKKGTEKTDRAVVGRYVLPPSIFGYLADLPMGHGSELQLTDALQKLVENEGLMGYQVRGTRLDAGCKIGYIRACLMEGLSRSSMRCELIDVMKEELARFGYRIRKSGE